MQVDDGERGAEGTGVVPTSSASMPTVVAVMLRALDVHAGQKVREIGTGTGYNVAVIADAARDALNRFAVNTNQQNVNLDLM